MFEQERAADTEVDALQLDQRHRLIVVAGPLQAVVMAAASRGAWRGDLFEVADPPGGDCRGPNHAATLRTLGRRTPYF
jgi:hypothetical protein